IDGSKHPFSQILRIGFHWLPPFGACLLLFSPFILSLGSRFLPIAVDQHTRKQIERLVRITGKPEKTVIREVVTSGLKTYSTAPSKSAQAVLDLIAWAEKEHITGNATDLSTNHNIYAWEE
ncbi:MAG TPA: hypothetical protein VEP90_01375, partial [Methylomirabilota bacterium]|nr:hypothetical protein [Methylomirabilota bacterium]